MLSTVLVTAIMFSGLPSGSTQITRAQANPSKSWENIFNNLFEKKEDNQPSVPSGGGTSRAMNRNEDNPPPVPSGGGTSRSINRNEDNRPPTPGRVGGSRGDKLCAIAPQPITTSTVVWSDRPLFVWRGVISRMEVRSTGSTKVLWSKKEIEGQSKEGQSSALYAGEAL
ncbi:MAG TPA: hypothetical protein DCP31_03065, partial [Cyanobacteria bacterium UBA8543]|nr:hypothetical protein [Cyanobacteria bacterium UBA8543]